MTITTDPNPGLVGPEPGYVIVDWTPPAITNTPRETLDKVNDTFERQLTVAARTDVCRVTYGTDRIGAQISTAIAYGASSVLLVCLWGRGDIQALSSLTIDNVTPPATVMATNYLGTTAQTVDAKLVSAFGALGITHTDALTGIAYTVLELQPGADIGDVNITVQGRKIYDPRDGTQTLGTPSTYKYSDNPALALADLITNTTYGLGAAIDWATVTTAANACDALVSGEKKRLIGLTLDDRKSAEEWVDVLRAHAGCWVVRSGSVYKLVPDAVASSVMTFNKADIIKGTNKWSMVDTDNAPNVVEITYTNTSVIPWATATAVYPANGVPPGGEDLRLSRRAYPGVQRYSQALREAIEFFNQSRLCSLTEEWGCYTPALTIEPGDVITLNNGGLSGGIQYRALSKPMLRKGRFTIKGRKYDPAAFDSSAVAAPSSANTTLPSAGTPPTVASITLTEEAVSVAAGALPLSKIRATWPGVSYPFFLGYKVVIKNAAGVTVDEGTTTGTTYLSSALNAFTTYTVTVQVYSSVAIGATMTGTITLVSLGIDSLATVWSQAFDGTLYYTWFLDGIENYTLWPGDKALRLRTLAAAEHVETAVYTGSDQLTPGRATQLLDDLEFGPFGTTPYSWRALSPVFNIGASRDAVFALYNLTKWINLYDSACECEMRVSESAGMTPYTSEFGWKTLHTGRYVQLTFRPKQRKLTSTTHMKYFWALEFDPGGIAALMPTVTDTFTTTSSASGGVTITLPRKYITVTSVQITAESVSQANPSYSNLTLSEVDDNTLVLHCYDTTNARVAVPCSISITGVAV
jgi:Putative phage tail protein